MSLALAFALALAPAPEPVFACEIGSKRLTVTQLGDALVYRYGTRRKAELRLVADAASGRVFYHRTLFARGEDQTLRFVNGDYDYVVYAHWTAPASSGDALVPEVYYGGVMVMRGDERLALRRCTNGGDMHERPIFETLPQDAGNRTPAE